MQLENIFKKMASLFSFEVIIGVSNFCAAIILARELGLVMFGIWGLIMLTLGYGEAFGRLKVDLASVHVLSKNKYSPQEIISSVNLITLFSSTFVFSLVFLFSDLVFELLLKEGAAKVSDSLYMLGLIFFLQNYFFNYLYMNLALQRTTMFGFYNMLRSLLFLIGVLLLQALDTLNLVNILTSLAFSFITILVVMIIDFHLKHGKPVLPQHVLNLSLLKKGWNYYFLGITSQINFSVVLIIASQYLTGANIGVFYTAKSLSDLFYSRLASAASGILYPLISNMEGGTKEKKAITVSVYIRVSLLFVACYFLLFFNWDFLVIVLYGAEYQKVGEIMNYLGVGSVVYFSTTLLVAYLGGTGTEIFAVIPHLLSIILQMITILFFITEVSLLSLSLLYVFSFTTSSLLLLIIFFIHKEKKPIDV